MSDALSTLQAENAKLKEQLATKTAEARAREMEVGFLAKYVLRAEKEGAFVLDEILIDDEDNDGRYKRVNLSLAHKVQP